MFSPDGDRRADRLLRYELSEEARGLLFVNGRRRGLTRFPRPADRLIWNGGWTERVCRPGLYQVQLSARDPAGNLAARTEPKASGCATSRSGGIGS